MFKEFQQLFSLKTNPHHRLMWEIVLFLVIATLSCLLSLLSKPASTTDWLPAKQAVNNQGLLQNILNENSDAFDEKLPLTIEDILVLKTRILDIFDFNNQALCGQAGCLYTVYTREGKQVLSLLLNPDLPEGVELFTVTDIKRNGLPCLIANQRTTDNHILRSLYCYENGTSFIQVNQTIVEPQQSLGEGKD
ncbi:MAG: hypothetical protein F6J89_20130 [Symploca sp. SIO1C4]|uniref:Uncharacterized protein n=1 Tax=Symploca sp. SIO1C4 TaxID=2607765 RepID=A0A6B3NE39_9CYAN|nr:hypothetical protein [Symploca sp. SIO1C4]